MTKMYVNENPDMVVMHRDVFNKLMSIAGSDESNMAEIAYLNAIKHTRKFNSSLKVTHQQKVAREQALERLYSKKLHILMRLWREARAKGETLQVWAQSQHGYHKGYHLHTFGGVRHMGNNIIKRYVKITWVRTSNLESSIVSRIVHIRDIMLPWSSKLDSYNSSIISAAQHVGLVPCPNEEHILPSTFGEKVILNRDLGLISLGFVVEKEECHTL